MKITALTNNNSTNQQLANYALSLFEQVKIEVVNYTELSTEEIGAKIEDASLVMLLISEEKFLPKNVISNKPILLISTFKNGFEADTIELMNSCVTQLQKSGNSIWGTYRLIDEIDSFNADLEIENIGKRLELIRMINSIMFHNLGIRNNNKFSCGITPPKHYVGDSIGY